MLSILFTQPGEPVDAELGHQHGQVRMALEHAAENHRGQEHLRAVVGVLQRDQPDDRGVVGVRPRRVEESRVHAHVQVGDHPEIGRRRPHLVEVGVHRRDAAGRFGGHEERAAPALAHARELGDDPVEVVEAQRRHRPEPIAVIGGGVGHPRVDRFERAVTECRVVDGAGQACSRRRRSRAGTRSRPRPSRRRARPGSVIGLNWSDPG